MEKAQKQPSKRSLLGLNGLLFCISDIRHGIGPLLSIHLRGGLHWDPALIGSALAAVEFSAFLCQLPAGLLADSTKSKRAFIAFACFLIIAGCLTYLLFSNFTFIMLAQTGMGIAVALITPILNSLTLGLFGKLKFPSRIGKNEVWNHFGNVVTALSAGFAGYMLGSRWIFYILIGFALGSLFFVSLIRAKEINHQVAREMPENMSSIAPMPLARLFKNRAVIAFIGALILYYIANGAQLALVGQVLATQNPPLGALFIALGMLIAETAMIVMAYLMSRIVNRFNRKTFFLAAFLILPIRALLFAVATSPIFILMIQILDGIAAGIMAIIATLIIADLATNTGRFNFLQGLGAMSIALGEALSQILAGNIAKFFGFQMSFLFLASVAMIGIIYFAVLMPETKKWYDKT